MEQSVRKVVYFFEMHGNDVVVKSKYSDVDNIDTTLFTFKPDGRIVNSRSVGSYHHRTFDGFIEIERE